jgi:hypothetical protein
VSRREEHRTALRALDVARWPAYLGQHSGLPGPRANIELAQAVADEGDASTFDRLIATDDEYLVCCGVIGLGRLLADGGDLEERLRGAAGPRRSGVAGGTTQGSASTGHLLTRTAVPGQHR